MKFPSRPVSKTPEALVAEGDRHLYGLGTDQSFPEALMCYRRAASKGCPAAMYRLGCMYESGHGTGRNLRKAYFWYDRAAVGNDTDAMAALGFLYEGGLGTRRSRPLAVENLEKAANRGSPRAMNNLGLIYMHDRRPEYAEHAAVTWMQKGNLAGFPPQTANLARLYETGRGVGRNCSTASNLFRKAAKQGNLPAKVRLAEILKYGMGVEARPGSAGHLFLEAARWGDPVAIAELEGGEADPDVFAAAPSGDPNPRTQLAEGLMFLFGCRAPYAPETAFFLMESAAEAGCTEQMYALGQAYEYGIGCGRSVRTAKKWYSWGADKGNAACAYVLGWMWESGGEYGEADADMQLSYYRAASGSADADDDIRQDQLYAIASLLSGPDPEESGRCMAEAARLGHPGAQFRAGAAMIDRGDEGGWEMVSESALQGNDAARSLLGTRGSGRYRNGENGPE